MTHAYSMSSVQSAAERAVRIASHFLRSEVEGSRVHDVQADPRFQHRGVDLLWESPAGGVTGVEVKGDRQGHRHGNFFFELVSNLEKDTPGCFLYSTADLVLYVFLERLDVHLLPLPEVRRWFLPRAKRYPIRHTRTQMGTEGYTTLGVLVPVREVLEEVPGTRRVRVESDLARAILP